MALLDLLLLTLIFFFTSVISVVTGATSLITVPALLAFGVPPTVALGTNMLALVFLSVGASVPFLKGEALDRPRLPLLIALTLVGSVAGALLVFAIPPEALPLIVGVAMLMVAVIVLRPGPPAGAPTRQTTPLGHQVGYGLSLLLAVYGGFFSGGYVTLLTAVFVGAFQMPLLRAVATTKVVNLASSLVATGIFAWRGVIDWQLGAVLSVTMFLGATLGARWTLRLPAITVRRIFVVTVMMLALKTLVVDVPWAALVGNRF